MPSKGQAMPPEQRRKISAALRLTSLPESKLCTSCGQTKPAADFTRRASSASGFVLRSHCRACEHAKNAAAYARVRSAKPRRPTAVERFMQKVIKSPGGCWIWVGSRKSNGYGSFKERSHHSVNAHRWSYEQHVGPIPDGLQIDHLCRNRACVNPVHLDPVTCRTNLLRGQTVTARNASRTHCPQGHPYDEANTARTSEGHRLCRACRRERGRRLTSSPERSEHGHQVDMGRAS